MTKSTQPLPSAKCECGKTYAEHEIRYARTWCDYPNSQGRFTPIVEPVAANTEQKGGYTPKLQSAKEWYKDFHSKELLMDAFENECGVTVKSVVSFPAGYLKWIENSKWYTQYKLKHTAAQRDALAVEVEELKAWAQKAMNAMELAESVLRPIQEDPAKSAAHLRLCTMLIINKPNLSTSVEP